MTEPGSDEALAANRAGRLSEQQLRRLEGEVSASSRNLIGAVIGALTRMDKALAEDVRAGHVESIEGAITKKRGADWLYLLSSSNQGMNPEPDYWISVANREVGNRQFRASRAMYDSAPAVGFVRLYYLPRSRRLLNLEVVSDRQVEDPSPVTRPRAAGWTGWMRRDKVDRALARSKAAGSTLEAQSYLSAEPPPASQRLDTGAVAEAIIGTWSNPFMTVTFGEDRVLTIRLADRPEERSEWSVDDDGHLCAELMGTPQVADVSLAGETLTLTISGRSVKLLRSAAG
jgi:hypothetical protein